MELLITVIKPMAYFFNAVMRRVPNFITDNMAPGLMDRAHLRQAKTNSFGIQPNVTNQSICAKYCGKCPSNPFTHGGLYCISGKSKKEVKMLGCLCFDCPIFDICGGKGYYCKDGSADEMQTSSRGRAMPMRSAANNAGENPAFADANTAAETAAAASKRASLDFVTSVDYEKSFIQNLLHKENAISADLAKKRTESAKDMETQIYYSEDDKKISAHKGDSILQTSLKNNIPHTHACGGQAKCSTCRILVLKGRENLGMRNNKEAMMADMKLLPVNVRLACQTVPMGGEITIRRLVKNEQEIEQAIAEGRKSPPAFGIDKHVAILFSDIRSFTSFSEKNLPYDIVYILNDYFEHVSGAIDKYNGYVDKYIGDGIMAIFGLKNEDAMCPEESALRAALAMIDELEIFNATLRKKYNTSFDIGIGIEAGEVVLAQIGFSKKRQFTAIGDVVNTSSRIEAANKDKGTTILVSQNIYDKTMNIASWGEHFSMKVKGKEKALQLYEAQKIIP